MKAKLSLYVYATLLMTLLGLAAGCSRSRNDAQVAGDVQGKIYSDPNIQSKQISVQSSNGVVTLSGTANSDAERIAAATDAGQVAGQGQRWPSSATSTRSTPPTRHRTARRTRCMDAAPTI